MGEPKFTKGPFSKPLPEVRKMQGDPKDLDATVAAVAFRDRLVPKADLLAHGVYPLWLGWALIEAFLAGIDYARKTDRSEVKDAG